MASAVYFPDTLLLPCSNSLIYSNDSRFAMANYNVEFRLINIIIGGHSINSALVSKKFNDTS